MDEPESVPNSLNSIYLGKAEADDYGVLSDDLLELMEADVQER